MPALGSTLAAIFSAILFLYCALNPVLLTGFINPEYWALDRILEAIGH